MRYNGGKNGSGVYQRIISMMPPHDVYIELFAGSAAILRRKRPAATSYAYELSPKTIAELCQVLDAEMFDGYAIAALSPGQKENVTIYNADAFEGLKTYAAKSMFWTWNDPAKTLIYADPPYLAETRKSKAKIYEFEMTERREHIRLLDALAAVPCKVMISGYESSLYNSKLKNWRKETIPTTNRTGQSVIETVWLNFPEPFELHDYEHVGENFRDPWRIEKKARTWVRRLAEMPSLERYAILGRLNELKAEFAESEAEQNRFDDQIRAAIAKRREREAKAKTKSPATPAQALPAVSPGLFD